MRSLIAIYAKSLYPALFPVLRIYYLQSLAKRTRADEATSVELCIQGSGAFGAHSDTIVRKIMIPRPELCDSKAFLVSSCGISRGFCFADVRLNVHAVMQYIAMLDGQEAYDHINRNVE